MPGIAEWSSGYGSTWAPELATLDCFNLLSLDPYEPFPRAEFARRYRIIALALHPDQLNRGNWQPPAGVTMRLLNILKGYLEDGSEEQQKRKWKSMVTRGRDGWHSTWNVAGDGLNRSTPLPSYTTRMNAMPRPPPPPRRQPTASDSVIDLTEDTVDLTADDEEDDLIILDSLVLERERRPYGPPPRVGVQRSDCPPNERQQNLRNMTGTIMNMTVGIVRGESHAPAAHDDCLFIVVASLDGAGRLNFRVRKITIDHQPIDESFGATPHVTSTTYAHILSHGRLVGRFAGASELQISWFLQYIRRERRLPPVTMAFPNDNEIQTPTRRATNPNPGPRTPHTPSRPSTVSGRGSPFGRGTPTRGGPSTGPSRGRASMRGGGRPALPGSSQRRPFVIQDDEEDDLLEWY